MFRHQFEFLLETSIRITEEPRLTEFDCLSNHQSSAREENNGWSFPLLIGTAKMLLFSRACFTKSLQYGLTTIDLHRVITKRKCLARVRATFILLTSLRKPIPLLPEALTHENITMLLSRP
mmetsp:Transcript_20850/g.29731  ORF Transcript_20850/g.29731 Transcript_20850/m.29731 type:complete len:121 (+) Transcript_20850:325-687(+)